MSKIVSYDYPALLKAAFKERGCDVDIVPASAEFTPSKEATELKEYGASLVGTWQLEITIHAAGEQDIEAIHKECAAGRPVFVLSLTPDLAYIEDAGSYLMARVDLPALTVEGADYTVKQLFLGQPPAIQAVCNLESFEDGNGAQIVYAHELEAEAKAAAEELERIAAPKAQ